MPLPGFQQTGPSAPAAWFPETWGTEESDAALIARSKVDPPSFALHFQRSVTAIYRYCYHRLGSVERAEDATSEIFLKALAALPKHRDDQSFRSWPTPARFLIASQPDEAPRVIEAGTCWDSRLHPTTEGV
jgi:hypothetical protein